MNSRACRLVMAPSYGAAHTGLTRYDPAMGKTNLRKFAAELRKARAEMSADTSEEAYRQAHDALAGKTMAPQKADAPHGVPAGRQGRGASASRVGSVGLSAAVALGQGVTRGLVGGGVHERQGLAALGVGHRVRVRDGLVLHDDDGR